MLQTDRGSQDDQLEWLQKLRAREMDALVKENVNLRGELQRLRAQMPQIKILEEKVERHEGLEQQLQLRVEELQAQLDQCEKSQEQAQQQVQGLQEQLMSAKEKEVELEHARERARKAEEDRNALNLKILDLTGAKEEAKGQLIRSDKVCSELLEKIKERNAAVELMKLESKELQAAERSRIESHQQKVQELNAEITKLNMECQQLRQQESESCKAKEVMEERLKGKDHQLQSQEVELQRGVRAVEDAKVEGERRWAKSQDEAPNGRGAPWPRGKGGDRASLAAAAERLRAVTQNRTAPGKPAATATIRRAPVQTRATPVAAMAGGGDTGLTKSGAVAAFRQAREAGRHFDSGWSKTGPPAPKAWVPKNTLRGKVASTKSLAPFQKVFLEAPEDLSAEDVQSMEESREAQEISVEMPEQVLDAFPPISSFEDLQGILPDYAYEGLNAMGIEVPMPIQAQAIPMALAGLDVVGIAKTGSGKTLAYVLPALAHLEAQAPKPKGQGTPLALVLAPTRELAVQIADMAKAVTQFSGSGSNHPGGLSSAVLYGGGQGSKAWQVADVRNAGHLVAATPGRLLDVMDSSEVTLERVTLLVLDEADRMLECGFEEQVGRIGKTVRSDRQTLFFSATWPTQVQHMAQLMCSSDLPPVRILAGQRTDGEGPTSREDILQEVVVFEQPTWEERDNAKQELLYAHLREVLSDESHKTLVFVSRKNLADTLANRLKSEGFRANVMHGGKSQDSRLNTLEGFRNGEIQLLVTTDVMGRGLDIPGISHVVIYDMGDIEDYVHRIGRTARGPYGQGHALTFYEYDKKWPKLPRKLIDVLEQSGQEVPPELVALAEGGGQDGPVGNIRKPQGWKSWM